MLAVIVIPTFEKAASLEPLLRAVFARPKDAAPQTYVVVVDDASPDGTGAVAERLAKEFAGRMSVLQRPSRRGFGSAMRDGFRVALGFGADWVVSLDGDAAADVGGLDALFAAALKGGDVVLGARPDDTVAAALARVTLGLNTGHATARLRCLSRRAVEALLRVEDATGALSLVGNEAGAADVFRAATVFLGERAGLNVVEAPLAPPAAHAPAQWRRLPRMVAALLRFRRSAWRGALAAAPAAPSATQSVASEKQSAPAQAEMEKINS